MNNEFEKKIIDKITAPLYQVLNDIDLVEITEDKDIYLYILTGMKQRINKAISEYLKGKENE